ncbi:hypothetical protein BaRGS_00000812, partial [Batillaria attramentaria]
GPGLRVHFTDFANMLKAFIGSNYLTIAFAFRQSGLALGLAGLLVIATLTAHCCRLLAKCKYHAIRQILHKHRHNLTRDTNSGTRDLAGSQEESSTSSDSEDDSSSSEDPNTEEAVHKKLRLSLNYGDLGRECLGKFGVTLVNIAIVVTQFGFCVGYCIFIGNTVLAMFPLYNCTVPVVNGSMHNHGYHCVKITHLNALKNVYDVHVNELPVGPSNLRGSRDVDEDTLGEFKQFGDEFLPASLSALRDEAVFQDNATATTGRTTAGVSSASNISTTPFMSLSDVSDTTTNTTSEATSTTMSNTSSETTTSSNTTTESITNATTATTTHTITTTTSPTTTTPTVSTSTWPSWSNVSDTVLTRGKGVPSLKLLVLCPVLIFIFMALIRSVRQLGIISAMANFAIFVGCIEVLIFLIVGFDLSSTFRWYNLRDMPVFFGLVTSSYEGIGTILPIESSMEGNRHNFSRFLYGAVSVLTMVLASFGVMGYLRFGDGVEQMINANIPSGSWLSIAVNVCLCIGVLLTFPLMIYPVIDLAEIHLFGKGRCCGPRPERTEEKMSDQQSLLPKKEREILLPVAEKVSDKVPTWKRNILRVLIVLAAGGLAVLLKDNFAYISAFVGALGSTMLAYILPCLFHLRLCWSELPLGIKVKDITIIVLGVACGIAGIYTVLVEIVNNVKP